MQIELKFDLVSGEIGRLGCVLARYGPVSKCLVYSEFEWWAERLHEVW